MFSIFINKLKQAPESAVKTTFSIRIIFCILSLAFITLSCGSGAYEPEQNNSQSIYPHTTTFADPDLHGQYTLSNDINVCASCHGDDFQGGASLTSCFECHPPYPHKQGWNEPNQHGVAALAQEGGVTNCAITCHGEDYSGKGDATSCYDCHDAYPHGENWEEIINHGSYVNTNSNSVCATACHGTDFSGGGSNVSCYDCHSLYPHAQNWENPDSHGLNSIVNGQTTCQGCHGTDLLGGPSGISCKTCHDPYPHPTGWSDWDNHGNYVIANNNATCAINCHGVNFSGKGAATSCYTTNCHRPYPHNADWTTIDNPSNHGRFYVESYVIPPVISNDECASNCHGTDFSGGGSTISCDSCHDEGVFPHVDQGQTLWKQTGHQDAVNITLGTDAVCTECHSDYLKGVDGTPLITCTTYCHQPE